MVKIVTSRVDHIVHLQIRNGSTLRSQFPLVVHAIVGKGAKIWTMVHIVLYQIHRSSIQLIHLHQDQDAIVDLVAM